MWMRSMRCGRVRNDLGTEANFMFNRRLVRKLLPKLVLVCYI